jgi:hypothetical protein
MNGAFTGLSAGSAHGLAVDRHHTGGNANQRGDPGHEAALELLSVEGREDITEMIVGWRAAEERSEASEKRHFHAADINEGFGAGQHCEQCQKEHLIKRIHDLTALAVVGQILEMIEEYNRLAKGSAVSSVTSSMAVPLQATPEGRYGFNVSGICHVLLHPIGLPD